MFQVVPHCSKTIKLPPLEKKLVIEMTYLTPQAQLKKQIYLSVPATLYTEPVYIPSPTSFLIYCHKHLSIGCRILSHIKNTSDRKRGIRLESRDCNLLLFNFEALDTYKDEIISLIDGQTPLVFDEVHKVKKIDGRYAASAVGIAKNAQYVVATFLRQ